MVAQPIEEEAPELIKYEKISISEQGANERVKLKQEGKKYSIYTATNIVT